FKSHRPSSEESVRESSADEVSLTAAPVATSVSDAVTESDALTPSDALTEAGPADVAGAPVVEVDEAVAAETAVLEDAGSAALAADDLSPEELERRRAALEDVMELMRPAVQMDGGDLQLVDVDYAAGVVEVQLQGACGSCAISSTTLKGGVERLITERLEWVTEVRGGVDESEDPFESAALGRGAYVPRYY
ncbi:MAG: nitrogen-fixing NifU domain protein, partial [Acidimicrobiaceae bacterium]|nr:nitrogen-fixing NifU domain protein [Acidimicrobiaceae bacterium]